MPRARWRRKQASWPGDFYIRAARRQPRLAQAQCRHSTEPPNRRIDSQIQMRRHGPRTIDRQRCFSPVVQQRHDEIARQCPYFACSAYEADEEAATIRIVSEMFIGVCAAT